MKMGKVVLMAVIAVFFVLGCSNKYSQELKRQHIVGNGKDNGPRKCHSVPSDASIFITFKTGTPLNVTFLLGDSFFDAQFSLSFSTPFVEIGLQDQFPLKETRSDFLYLMIVSKSEQPGREKKIYCLDLKEQNIEIIPSNNFHPVRIVFSLNQMKIYDHANEVLRYETDYPDRHILVIDTPDGYLDHLEIKPLTSFPERKVTKPEIFLKYCQEALPKNIFSIFVVCSSDILESILGFLPWIVAHYSPSFAIFLQWIIYIAISLGLLAKAFFDKRLRFGFPFVLLLLFVCWLILLLLDILPYAFL